MSELDEVSVDRKGGSGTWIKVLAAIFALVLLLALWRILPMKTLAARLLEILQSIGPLGLVVLAGVYVIACVLFVPGSLLTLVAGLLAAAIWPGAPAKAVFFGTLAVSAGSLGGATVCFLLGRTLMRAWVEDRVRRNAKFEALDEAIAQSGFKMVFLLRLSPVFPFNLLNYALGVTKLRLRDYVLASWIGMLPATVLYVSLGTAGGGLLAGATGVAEKNTGEYLLLGAGIAATLGVVILVTRAAKQALSPETGGQPGSADPRLK